jgi:hypothetical protein
MDIEKIIKEVRDVFIPDSDKTTESTPENESFKKIENADDKIGKILEDAGNVVTGWFDAIASMTEPTVKRTKAKIYEGIQDEYRKAGAPYGDDHEGLLRWVDEHEVSVREKIDNGLEKGRQAVVETARKTKNFVDDKITEKQPPSEATIDAELTDDKKAE